MRTSSGCPFRGIRYPAYQLVLREAFMSAVQELATVSAVADAADKSLLTPQDAARFLKVSVSWVYEHVRPEADDRLPFVRLGKYLRFDSRDLRAYVDAKRAESLRNPRRR
jgi:excisionase family DNA binding protein